MKLKNKRGIDGLIRGENKDLKEKELKIVGEIERGIHIFAESVDSKYLTAVIFNICYGR